MSFEVDAQKPRELRVDRILSLRALGERNGVTYDTINKLQLGQRSATLSTIRKLAEVLEVQPRGLMNQILVGFAGKNKAAGPGFEPGLSDSESLVLPLHHPAR